jgi:hypothetical protein
VPLAAAVQAPQPTKRAPAVPPQRSNRTFFGRGAASNDDGPAAAPASFEMTTFGDDPETFSDEEELY